ncbi:phosphatidylinositol transfer protein 3-like isoform X2 [Panicum virgatum]|uniref:phosphatidylinositol transfer protein 3-like isoform X2 n=1 Tax=Panicum virgatum TaxID=38727 RepID=UPI0019D58347|nr:phosphatidylinositol transfer protein 3-like isoform X2 [Panicum virgatum]
MSYLFRTRSEKATQQKPESSEEQQRKIEDVRELLGDLATETPSFLSDGTIRRFLRARNWSTEKAAKSLKEAIKWRRQFKPETICWDDLAGIENEVRRAYIPDYLDKNGRTVFVIVTSIKSLTSTKEHIQQLVYNLENMAMNSEDAQENVVWMCNFSGWTLSSTPLWEIVKQFLEPTLQDKIKFVYNNNAESQRIMADMFDMDKLESAFGGRNTAILDITKYAERMRRRDQIRITCKNTNRNT